MGEAVHHDFERNRDLLLDLFGGASGPLRDDLNVVVGDIRVSFNGKLLERDDAPGEQQDREGDHKQTIIEGEVDQAANHSYCPTVFWKTSASRTTCWPGLIPDTTSCML